jgi:hypothetical protein
MIHWLNHTGEPFGFMLISEVLLSHKLGFLLIAAGLALALLGAWLKRRGESRALDGLTLAISSLVYAGAFIACSVFVDEVFINLEHSYNLYHHGRFSYSPAQSVGGTVELLYYALLAPFARGQAGLIRADFALGGVVGWAHVALAWALLPKGRFAGNLVLMILFSLNYPLITVFGDGFGNCLVSLAIMVAIHGRLSGRLNRYLWCAALLPLIRPDALIYSAALFAVDGLQSREPRWRHYAAAALAAAVYFSVYQLLFGRLLPIPIEFKSPSLPLLQFFGVWGGLRIATLLHDLPSLIGIAIVVFLFFRGRNAETRFFVQLSIACAGIFVFYKVTTYGVNYDGRYYVGFLLVLALAPLVCFGRPQNRDPVLEPIIAGLLDGGLRGRLVLSILAMLLVGQYAATMKQHREMINYRAFMHAIDGYGIGGQLMERILPEGWSVATTELNSFGFMHEREIIDLWGYTNASIARSDWTSKEWGIKVDPDFFLKQRPIVYWHRTFREGTPESLCLENMEDFLLLAPNLRKTLGQLGDIPAVLTHYDPLVLKHGKWVTVMLVLRGHLQPFLDHLAGRQFELMRARPLDHGKVRALWEADGPVENHLIRRR